MPARADAPSFAHIVQAAAAQGDTAWFDRWTALGFSPRSSIVIDDTAAMPLQLSVMEACVQWDPSGQVPLRLLEPFWAAPTSKKHGLALEDVRAVWSQSRHHGNASVLRGIMAQLPELPERLQRTWLSDKHGHAASVSTSFTQEFWRDHLADLEAASRRPASWRKHTLNGAWLHDLQDWILPDEWRPSARAPSNGLNLHHTLVHAMNDGHGALFNVLWAIGVPITPAIMASPMIAQNRDPNPVILGNVITTAIDLLDAMLPHAQVLTSWTIDDVRTSVHPFTDVPPQTPLIDAWHEGILSETFQRYARQEVKNGSELLARLNNTWARWETVNLTSLANASVRPNGTNRPRL